MPTTNRVQALTFALMASVQARRIGERIRHYRKLVPNRSQADLAREMGGKVTGTMVSRWERGENRPNDGYLERIAEVLEIDVAELLVAPPSGGPTPDVMGAMSNGGHPSLEEIDAKLDDAIAQLRLLSALLFAQFPAQASKLQRQIDAQERKARRSRRPSRAA